MDATETLPMGSTAPATEPPATMFAPDRIVTLDALRGFAVMGILAMNIVAFAMPQWAYVSPLGYGGETLADRMIWLVSFILFDGKMRGLFSLLFGASMLLIIDRAGVNGESARQVHYARMGWLALFGIAHYFFIWFGDILFLYAAVGSLAFLFHEWESRRLIKWALAIYAIGFVVWAAQFGGIQILQYSAAQPGASADVIKQAKELFSSPQFDADPVKQLAIFRGSYSAIFAHRMGEWYTPLTLVAQSVTETLPFMMIGMAMMKNGFISGDRGANEYARWARKLVLPGLVINALLGAWVVWSGYNLLTALAALIAWGLVPRLLLTVGYAALLILLIQKIESRKILGRVAATGRAAFTNYLGTSIVMTTIFYGYGFGLFGSISRVGLWGFVIAAWAIMLLWSKPWLDRFHYGPLEWLWRSLAKRRMQPMRKVRLTAH
jgi:uncharacterized protein